MTCFHLDLSSYTNWTSRSCSCIAPSLCCTPPFAIQMPHAQEYLHLAVQKMSITWHIVLLSTWATGLITFMACEQFLSVKCSGPSLQNLCEASSSSQQGTCSPELPWTWDGTRLSPPPIPITSFWSFTWHHPPALRREVDCAMWIQPHHLHRE